MGQETFEWYNTNCLIGFAKARGTAWHYRKSSQTSEPNHYDDAIPVDDVIRRLLFWEALSADVSLTYPDDNADGYTTITDPTRQAIIRPDTNTVFGIFKQSYQIHQHKEWLRDLTSHILDTSTSDLGIANAILLRGGAVACLQFEVPETIKSTSGFDFRPSLFATGSMDGSLATTFGRTINAIVCDNTLAVGLSSAKASNNIVKVKHSKYSKLKLENARDALDVVFETANAFEAELNALLAIEVTPKAFKKYLDIVVPVPEPDKLHPISGKPANSKAIAMADKKREDLLTLWLHDDRVSPWSGTAFGVWQLNNTYNHHIVGTNGDTIRGERNMFQAASGAMAKSDSLALDTLFTKVLA